MTKTELAKLLTYVSTFDSRTVGIDTVEAWHTILEPVDYQAAVEAVRKHFATSDAWLLPAHIVSGVRARGLRLVSDSSVYCVHNYPVFECVKGCSE
jgi:hypothetical protein